MERIFAGLPNRFNKFNSIGRWLVIVVLALATHACTTRSEQETTDTESNVSYNPLPISLLTLDSATFSLSGKNLHQPMVVIFFSPGCDHCEKQADELSSNLNSLKNTTIVMVASARPEDIRSFAQERNLDGFENIKFAIGNPVDVFSVYGQITVPHLVLYSKNHGKIREFSGVTQVSEFKRFLE